MRGRDVCRIISLFLVGQAISVCFYWGHYVTAIFLCGGVIFQVIAFSIEATNPEEEKVIVMDEQGKPKLSGTLRRIKPTPSYDNYER